MASSDFLKVFTERGFQHQCTHVDDLQKLLNGSEQPVPAYIGFDCTAPSLHVGSLIQIMALRQYQQCGHKPIVLLGGGTTKVGDPSGKDASRQLLDEATIAANKEELKKVFARFLTFEETYDKTTSHAFLVDNSEWLDNLNYIEFLRDVGRYFSVNRMLTMESVKQRLERESHLSFLEFNYMILQAYDFVELNRRYGCRLQIGGSDQWGNIVMGIDLYTKFKASKSMMLKKGSVGDTSIEKEKKKFVPSRDWEKNPSEDLPENITACADQIFGLTTPLLTTASGAKMGKTADGAIWLNPEMLSAYEYWQFWRNCDDADVGRFLKLFTELPLEAIAELEALPGAEINEAKKRLATEATALLHGRDAATQAEETARRTFEEGQAADTLPTITLNADDTGEPLPAFKLFHLAGLVASGGEARRLIKGGGARIDDEKVTDENQPVTLSETSTPLKLSSGKKKHVLVKRA